MRVALLFAATMLLVPAVADAQVDTLRVGDRAPDFVLPAATRDSIDAKGIRLSDLWSEGLVVLAFYPADWSGGCSKEMCTFRDAFAELAGVRARVLGISGDYVYSHREWAKHLDLPFPLLSDHDHAVAKRYQSYNERSGYNLRTVFLVGRDGTLRYIDRAYRAGSPESFAALKTAVQTDR